MDRSAMPQLWGLATAPLSADLADEAEGLAAAELAEVGLADRLRGGTGRTVQVRTTAGPVAGRVVEVVRDAAQLATLDGAALVALPAVLTVAGLVGAARAPRGRERAGGLTLLRQWQGRRCTAMFGDADVLTGEVTGVAADHFMLGGVAVAWTAVAVVRTW